MGGMANSGQGNPLGNALVRTGIGFGGRAPVEQAPTPTGASFTPVSPSVYSPAFSSSQQTPMQQGISPLLQQIMQQRMNPYGSGLAGLYTNISNPVAQEVVRPMAMPTYAPSALAYRPNLDSAQAKLSQVAPSVVEQQRLAEEARLREETEQPRRLRFGRSK